MTKGFLLTLFLFAWLPTAFAQEKAEGKDTVLVPLDSTQITTKGKKVVTIDTYARRFDPKRAMMLSATFPGWGQAYNNKYWKLPIVYGGFAVGIFVIDHYQELYTKYKNELFIMINDPTMTTSPLGYSEDQLRHIVSTSRRQRDFFCIVTGFWYMFQIVDAHVDAHLKEFDLNPQLQVSLEPAMENSALTGRTNGFSIIIKF